MLIRVFVSLGLLVVLSFAQQVDKDMLLSKAVFEEKVVWDNIRGNVRKMLPVQRVKKGARLIYVNQVLNQSQVTKKQTVIDNPIPYGASYVRGTASCEGSCKMLYSIDGGTTFKKSEELFVIYGTKRRMPLASEYTHIKFIFSKLEPYVKVRMAFQARVK